MMNREILFGPFRFDPTTRVLWDGDTPARLGARALAILGHLLETPGVSVSRDELIRAAWPGLHVDQGNLRVQISTLRKALREQGKAIQSSASQGYCFAGDIVVRTTDGQFSAARPRLHVPSPLTPPVGRAAVVARINELFATRRLVSILGPGGIGKTTVAMQIASGRADDYLDGACFVDLGRSSAAASVNTTIASSAHLAVTEWPSNDQIALALRNKHMLLVLDCCEHVLDPVARLVEHLLAKTSIDILVTTREPLRTVDEEIWHLEPLAVPPSSAMPINSSDLRDYASVQLLLQSINHRGANLQVGGETSAEIADVSRRLEGIPLAIELAASMIATLGLSQVLRSLDESAPLITIDRRSTTPRQRSLFATIEWSYNLLSDEEQSTLKCLSCFAGPFTVEAGVTVAQGDNRTPDSSRDAILALARKSLLASHTASADGGFRLLDTTRAFIAQTPDPSDDRDKARERHARYILARLELTEWNFADVQSANAIVGNYVGEVRLALDWSFEVAPWLGVQLVLAAERLWLELTSLFHGAPYIARALGYADTDPSLGPVVQSRLLVSLASAQAYIPGGQGADLYERAWNATRDAGDDFLELRALYGLIQSLLLTRRPASSHLDEFAAISRRSDHPATYHLYQRMRAFSEFESSKLMSAQAHFESFLNDFRSIPRSVSLYFGGMDSVISSKVGLALSKYYMGYCDQARLLLETAVQDAERLGHATTSYFVLAQGAIWANINSRDFERAHAYLHKLERLAAHYRPWQALVDAFRGLIATYEHDDAETAARLLTSCLQDPYMIKTGSLRPILWIELANARRQAGDIAGAEAALENAWAQCLGTFDVRVIGKHHPARADLLMARNEPGDIERARLLLQEAIDLSQASDFYLYQCEATVILATLERNAGHIDAARSALTRLVTHHGDRENVPLFARAQSLLAEIETIGSDTSD
ncbi:ATP-binding protein [Tardiphaga sp. 42S5]|uniref:ATP-binding protein n=1 Tax=Tardiphaga sp. 42S5 TaxID=1404799 RepID=UPI002A59CF18|nr:winged helix-turn-helix domain-containing protein [Tardiphaga sp. 42S5]WPO42533.1 winged helix-turn-helix domain-containing protein [Tardiphaga sp. 42S5]